MVAPTRGSRFFAIGVISVLSACALHVFDPDPHRPFIQAAGVSFSLGGGAGLLSVLFTAVYALASGSLAETLRAWKSVGSDDRVGVEPKRELPRSVDGVNAENQVDRLMHATVAAIRHEVYTGVATEIVGRLIDQSRSVKQAFDTETDPAAQAEKNLNDLFSVKENAQILSQSIWFVKAAGRVERIGQKQQALNDWLSVIEDDYTLLCKLCSVAKKDRDENDFTNSFERVSGHLGDLISSLEPLNRECINAESADELRLSRSSVSNASEVEAQ